MILPEVDRLSIILLMDNYTDRLLPLSFPAIRPSMIKNERFLPPPIAEHGFSALIKVSCNNENDKKNTNKTTKENTFLFDCGVSDNGVIYNADILGINFKSIKAIILSHGHLDHFTALPNVLEKIGTPTRLICHPDAFLKRWIVFPNGKDRAKMPFLDKEALQRKGVNVITKQGPSIVSENNLEDLPSLPSQYLLSTSSSLPKLLITGQIPRNTFFEKGFPLQYKEDPNDNNLTPDPLVNDDQAIVVNIKGKGLVIISACAHAGIINTINYAKLLTGIDKIFAVLGGFHLTGGEMYYEAIEPTIRELKNANPQYIVPCHCTGWKATNKIIQEMPEKFLQSSVCSTFTFESN